MQSIIDDSSATEFKHETETSVYNSPRSLLQQKFIISEQGIDAQSALEKLVANPNYDTDSTYYTTSTIDFVERHLRYLSTHPTVKLVNYLANLKLMTRIR